MSTEEAHAAVPLNIIPPSTRYAKLLWHQRLAHLNGAALEEHSDYIGIRVNKQPLDFCEDCAYAKSHIQPRNSVSHPKAHEIMHLVGLDLFEMRTTSLQGHKYVFGGADYAGPFIFLDFLKSKSEAVKSLRLLIEFAKTRGHPIKVVRMDNESIFRGSEVMKLLSDNNIEA